METSSAPMQRRNVFKSELSLFLGLWVYTVFIVELTRAFTVQPTVVAYVMACGDDGKVVDMTKPPSIDAEPAPAKYNVRTFPFHGYRCSNASCAHTEFDYGW